MKRLILKEQIGKKVFAKQRIRKNRILSALRDCDSLTYTEIANITRFSLPMVSKLVGELIGEGFVVRTDQRQSKVGRPANLVRLNPEAAYILGIDIGRTVTNMVLLNLMQERVGELSLPTVNVQNQDELIDTLDDEISQIISKAGISYDKILGIGIAVPGLVNSETGFSYTYLNFGDIPTSIIFEQRFRKPVIIENDVNAMALGELWFGKAKNVRNAACINLGWGIGMGLILNGELYRGSAGFAGEFGHMTVIENGQLCTCGKRGCLETVASGRAIGEIARKQLSEGSTSQLTEIAATSPDKIDEALIVEYAKKGDQFSIELLENAANYIGKSLAELINLLNLELIILGGRGSRGGEIILYPIHSATVRHSLADLNKNVRIRCSELGDYGGCLGAATLITKQIFDTSHIDVGKYV